MAPPSSAVLATGFSSPSPSSLPCVSASRRPKSRPHFVTIPRQRRSSPPLVPPPLQLSAAVAEQRAKTEEVDRESNHVKEAGCLGSCGSKGSEEFMERATANSVLDLDGLSECFRVVDWSEMLCCFDQRNFSASRLWGGLKFALLLALFTCQVSPQALAGTDFSGAQLMSYIGDLGDITTGFASAFLLIFFSELGDKTFFIAALLAARNSGAVVFLGTFGALAAMTIVSVVLGRTFHYVDDILPFRFGEADFPIDDFAAVCLLVYFGVTTLLDATSDDEPKSKEEQKEAELAISEFSGNGAGIMAAASTVVSTFVLVFVAEWGDKSFFSTIALAAASSPLGVIGGALAGHAVATLLAVLGGSLLGTFLSEKIIAYIGGVLFLVFAAVTLVEIVT